MKLAFNKLMQVIVKKACKKKQKSIMAKFQRYVDQYQCLKIQSQSAKSNNEVMLN